MTHRGLQWAACIGLVSSLGLGLPDLMSLSVDDAMAGLSNGSFTSVDLATAYFARIAEVNEVLHAVIELNPDALTIAATMDSMRRNGTVLGPLHGVPVLIKDNIATNDSMNTTAGSFALVGAKVPRDSTMAAKLRQAGAVILGKANLSQWANFRSLNSSNGWSARGNQTFGAWHTLQDPSGSSSGSAVGMSIGLATISLGSETDGSIISPAETNGVVGLKPTVGLTSRALVIPISSHQDTVGPITRTVKDAAYVLQAIAGTDSADNDTSAIPFNSSSLPDYVGACTLDGLRGQRLAIPRQLFNDDVADYVNASFTRALGLLQRQGATVLDSVILPTYGDFVASNNETIVLDSDFKQDLANYLSQLTLNPQNITSLASLINFTKSTAAEEYPSRDIAEFESAEATVDGNATTVLAAAVAADRNISDGSRQALDASNATLLVLPSGFASGIAAIGGYPILTVPLGYAPLNTTVLYNGRNSTVVQGPGLPYGISFISRRFDELSLIRAGYAFEQATLVLSQKRPLIVPTTQLVDVTGDGISFERKRSISRSGLRKGSLSKVK